MKHRNEQAKIEFVMIGIAVLLCALLIGYTLRSQSPSESDQPVKTASYAMGKTADQRKKETRSLQDKLFDPPAVSSSSRQAEKTEDKTDLNTATEKDLRAINGIGEKLANAILSYREQNGMFQSLDELKNIPGIGEKTLEAMHEKFYVKP